jgi:hypothetical protein
VRKFLVAASCLSLLSCATAASVKAAAPQGQHVLKASDTTDISARKKKPKKGMQPDASRQGGSGTGSDQGGTKVGK